MPSGRKISQFPAAAGINYADVVGGVQNGVSTKFSFATIFLWLKSVLIPSDIGAQDKITVSGILKGDGAGGVSAATAGTDYATPAQIPDIEANPSGTATDTLTKLQVDNTIYAVSGGGGIDYLTVVNGQICVIYEVTP